MEHVRILVVEDEDNMRRLIKDYFKKKDIQYLKLKWKRGY